jgi:beta-ureidopropionase / N-carbamoyl-L-amino-acid hydrolase
MVKANPDRVLRDLYALREIGRYKTGVHRPTLSPEDVQARQWLADALGAIGHEAVIDGIANVVGRAPGPGPHLLCGSHIESQNHAGWLDGALGVVYALEAARAVAEDAAMAGRGVDVIAFADEEGHFSGSFLGSKSFVGDLDEAAIDAAEDRSGRGSLRDCLAAAGLAGRRRTGLEPGRYAAFLEAHIEQGDRLESQGLSIGIVTSIVAICQYRIAFDGQQNHAGTTRMAARRDAGSALMRLWHRIEETFPSVSGPHSVWTVGRVTLDPGAPSIIPGRAEMLVQFRDADQANLDRMHAQLERLVREADAAGPCAARLDVLGQSRPAAMDPEVQGALEEAAELLAPGRHVRMPSGAGHDAQFVAPHVPTGMLFVPSIGGISHHWSENTADEDIALGAEVYVEAAARLLTRARQRSSESQL